MFTQRSVMETSPEKIEVNLSLTAKHEMEKRLCDQLNENIENSERQNVLK